MAVLLAVYLASRPRSTPGCALAIDHSIMFGYLDATTDTGLNVSGQPIFSRDRFLDVFSELLSMNSTRCTVTSD